MSANPSTDLALIAPPQRLYKPNRRDKNLWLSKKRGWTEEQLGVKYGISEKQVRNCIDRWQLFVDAHSNDMIDLEYNQMFERILPKQEKVLTDAMKAEHTVIETRGKKIIRRKVADHATRLKAVRAANDIRTSMLPKGVGVQVNTQINNPGQQTQQGPRGFDFEARLRKIREEEGLGNNDAVLDAEYEEEAPSTAAEELADIGIELDDDDEDEDE